jgi:hypothetical protein
LWEDVFDKKKVRLGNVKKRE